MGSRWHKLKNIDKRERHTLHSLGVGFVFFVVLFILTKVSHRSLCLMKNLFGISCFGCGMTRGFMAILNLDLKTAIEYNALSVPLFAGCAVYFLCALIDFFFDKRCVCAFEKQLSKIYMYPVYAIILTVATVLNNAC